MLPLAYALGQPVQLNLKGRAGGVPLGHAAGKFGHRVPELSAHPLELGIIGLLQQSRDGRRRLNLRGVGGVDVGRTLAPQLKAQALVLLADDPLR